MSLKIVDGNKKNYVIWKINGFPARVECWTQREWDKLQWWERPKIAQCTETGIWVSLVVE